MSTNKRLFTSESVTEGHPAKIADQISDGVLDAILSKDPYGRVACETLLTTGLTILQARGTETVPQLSFFVSTLGRYLAQFLAFSFSVSARTTSLRSLFLIRLPSPCLTASRA